MRLRYATGNTFSDISTAPSGPYVLNGETGLGRHLLIFTFYFSGWVPPNPPRILDGHLLLTGPNAVPEVGRAHLRPNSSGWETGGKLDFVLDLDSQQLERVCGLPRAAGSSIQFSADLVLLVSGTNGVQRLSGNELISFPPKMWFDALSNAGFGETLVSELTIPRSDARPSISTALSSLRDALGALRDCAGGDARSREAVSTCRLAFEAGALDAAKHAALPGQNQTMAMTKPERLQTLRWAVKLVGHLAHHDPNVQWSKRDARLMTLLTGALLEWEAGSD